MSPKPEPAGYCRTRADHASEIAEDYVEAIAEIIASRGVCRVTDLVARFAVSHVTVNRTVHRLVRDGYAVSAPYAPICLTAQGSRLAKKARERHEVVLAFLIALGITPETAAIDSEGIEHHVSPETLDAMRAFLETKPDHPSSP